MEKNRKNYADLTYLEVARPNTPSAIAKPPPRPNVHTLLKKLKYRPPYHRHKNTDHHEHKLRAKAHPSNGRKPKNPTDASPNTKSRDTRIEKNPNIQHRAPNTESSPYTQINTSKSTNRFFSHNPFAVLVEMYNLTGKKRDTRPSPYKPDPRIEQEQEEMARELEEAQQRASERKGSRFSRLAKSQETR